MKRLRWLTAVLLTLACVPSGADSDPHGSAGVITEPSAPTRGEAFTSTDGWTLHIDELAFISVVTARSAGFEEPAEERFLWNVREPAELIVRAVPTGVATVSTGLQSAGRRFDANGVETLPYLIIGASLDADQKLRAAFSEPPGASVYAVVRAEKGDRSERFELLIPTPGPRPDDPNVPKLDVTVTTDDVTFAHLEVHAEVLFATFEPFAESGSGLVGARPMVLDGLLILKP